MSLDLTGKPTYIRMLSWQLTGHVIWANIEPLTGVIPLSRIPNCATNIDYVTYSGPGPIDLQQFYRHLKNYELVCDMSSHPTQFEIIPIPLEFRDAAKLTRAKCYAFQSIQNLTNWAIEKNGLSLNPLADSSLDHSVVEEIYQRQLNVDVDSAKKLLQFKLNEYNNELQNIKYTQIEAEMAITAASTIQDVVGKYKDFLTALSMTRANENAILRLV